MWMVVRSIRESSTRNLFQLSQADLNDALIVQVSNHIGFVFGCRFLWANVIDARIDQRYDASRVRNCETHFEFARPGRTKEGRIVHKHKSVLPVSGEAHLPNANVVKRNVDQS
jgi:hypothetical protein